MSEPVLIYATWPSAETALNAARQLVGQALCACVNILPGAMSVYRWKDAIESEPEAVMFLKTRRDRVEALRAALEALHPYEMPAFVVLDIDRAGSSPPYLDWLMREAAPPGGV